MDKIDLTSGMPRTVYHDQAVPPRAHILRALGGPLYSALGLVLSLVIRSLLPRKTIAHEVAGWSSIGHGLIFAGSLAPLPIVDGGSILKWSLVESGRSPTEADQVVEQAGIATGIAACTAGAALAARRRWLPAAGLLAAGLISVAAAKRKITWPPVCNPTYLELNFLRRYLTRASDLRSTASGCLQQPAPLPILHKGCRRT